MKNLFIYTLSALLSFSALQSFSQAKTPIHEVMQNDLMQSGADGAIKHYKDLKKNQPNKYDFNENELQSFGLGLLRIGRADDARKFLTLNAESFPKSSTAVYFLGFIEYKSNNNALALTYLQKALKMNKANASARDLITAIQMPKVYALYKYKCPACACSQDNLLFKEPGICLDCQMALEMAPK